MKKVFIEPKIKKIELNIKENIANSGGGSSGPAYLVFSNSSCFIVDTGFTMKDVDAGKVTAGQLDSSKCVFYLNDNENTKMTGYVTRKQLFGY